MEDDSTGFAVCEICSQVSDKTCENASELEEISSVLAVDFALSSFQNKNICEKCRETIKKFKTFKMQLIKTEGELSSDCDVKVKAECSVETEVCKLCKNNIDIAELQPLAFAVDEHSFQDLMQKHFPEIHVSVSDAQICKTCIQWLEDFKTFTSTLQFLRAKPTDMKCEITDNNVEDMKIKSEIDLKSELGESMDTETDSLAETDSNIKIEESDMVDEDTRRNMKKEFDSNRSEGKCAFQTSENLLTHKQTGKNKCAKLIYKTNRLEDKMFKCTVCTYETERKGILMRHALVHKNPQEVEMFKCTKCAFETKRQYSLKIHMLVHRNPQEVRMFKCEVCTFETKYRVSLRNHVLIHRNPQELMMFKCSACTYESKCRQSLKKHTLVHQNPSEVKMFRCTYCYYRTKYQWNLSKHILNHRNPQEAKKFKCTICTYEARHRGYLTKHMLVHRNPEEVEMFKCAECTYEAKRPRDLKVHSIVHKNPEEVMMFKCATCSYETKLRRNLKKHQSVHKNS